MYLTNFPSRNQADGGALSHTNDERMTWVSRSGHLERDASTNVDHRQRGPDLVCVIVLEVHTKREVPASARSPAACAARAWADQRSARAGSQSKSIIAKCDGTDLHAGLD